MNGFMSGLLGMDEDPRKAAQRAGLLGLGATLLQAGGPSTQPTSLGQALGSGVMTGRAMAQDAYSQAAQAQASQALQEAMGGVASMGGADQAAKLRQLAMMPGIPTEQANLYLRLAEQAEGKAENLGGDAANIARSMFGTADVRNLTPEQRQQVMQMAQQQQMSAASAAAPNISLKMGNTLGTEIAKAQVPLIQGSYNQAKAANNTLNTINSIEGVIDNAFAGPGSTVQTALARVGQQLGFGGANQQEVLNNTVSAMQGLAKLQLDAAQALQGQGQISDKERALVERAAGGDLTQMTSGEVKTLVNALKKSADYQVKSHNDLVDKTSEMLPEAQGMFNNFKIKPVKAKRLKYNPETGQVEEQ